MKIIKDDDFKTYRESKQIIGVKTLPAIPHQTDKNDEIIETLKAIGRSLNMLLSKQAPTPQITVKAPEITVKAPEIKPEIQVNMPVANGWEFKAKKTGDTWNIVAKRIE